MKLEKLLTGFVFILVRLCFGKNFFLGQGLGGDSFRDFQELSQYFKLNSQLLRAEAENNLWLSRGTVHLINSTITLFALSKITIQSLGEANSSSAPRALIKLSDDAGARIEVEKCSISFDQIDFFYSAAAASTKLLILDSTGFYLRNSTFSGNISWTNLSASTALIYSSCLVAELVNITVDSLTGSGYFLSLQTQTSVTVNMLVVTRSKFALGGLLCVRRAQALSVENIVISESLVESASALFEFQDVTQSFSLKRLSFCGNRVQGAPASIMSLQFNPSATFCNIEHLNFSFNKLYSSNPSALLSIEGNDQLIMSLLDLTIASNERSSNFISIQKYRSLELTDSQILDNSGAELTRIQRGQQTFLKNVSCRGSNRGYNYASLPADAGEISQGSCLVLIEAGGVTLEGLDISGNSAINSTAGIKIVNEEPGSAGVLISKCSFVNNIMFYNRPGDYSAALFIASKGEINIIECLFKGNKMNSTRSVLNKVGGPCGKIFSGTKISVSQSVFSENKSKFHATCLALVAPAASLVGSAFEDNAIEYDLFDFILFEDLKDTFNFIQKVSETIRGAVFVSAELITVINNFFFFNEAFQGQFYVDGTAGSMIHPILFMAGCKFVANIAAHCNSIFPGKFINSLQLNVANSLFTLNVAGAQGVFSTLYPVGYGSVSLSDSLMVENYAEFAAVGSFEQSDYVLVSNNVFIANQGKKIGSNFPASISTIIVISSGASFAKFVNNVYFDNWTFLSSTTTCYHAYCEYNNESLKFNVAGYYGGVYADMGAQVIIRDCSFVQNTASNGGCIGNIFSYLTIQNSSFFGCAALKGGALFALEGLQTVMINSTVSQCRASSGTVVSSLLSRHVWRIINCDFINNTSENELFQVSESTVGFFFQSCRVVLASSNVFTITDFSVAVISDSFFRQIDCRQNLFGCLSSVHSSVMNFTNNVVASVKNSAECAGIFVNGGSLQISNSSFWDLKTEIEAGAVSAEGGSEIQIVNSSFFRFSKSCISISESAVTIKASQFNNYGGRNNSDENLPAVKLTNCVSATILASSFICNSGTLGGAISINSELSKASTQANISFCAFYNNSALDGAALHIQNGISIISSNEFYHNIASGQGGAIFFFSQANISDATSPISVLNNTFGYNKASIGSIFRWQFINPVYAGNEYKDTDNKDGITSFPVRLRLVTKRNESMPEDLALLHDIPPGLPLGFEMQLHIIDTYGDVYRKDEDHLFSVYVKDQPQFDAVPKEEVYMLGQNLIKAVHGVFDLSKIVLRGKEEGKYYIFFDFLGIQDFHSNFVKEQENVLDSPADVRVNKRYMLRIPFRFRKCKRGEISISSLLACIPCAYGFFSFNPSEGCRKCPDGAFCLGSDQIFVKNGFWRRSADSSQIHFCEENAKHCLSSAVSRCEEGYTGVICGSCERKYAKNSFGTCVYCQESSILTYFKLFAYLLSIAFFCIIMIKSAIRTSSMMRRKAKDAVTVLSSANSFVSTQVIQVRNANSNKSKLPTSKSSLVDLKAAYYKILVNFIQLIGIVRSLKINWPSYVQEYMKLLDFLSIFSIKILTLGCLAREEKDSGFPFVFKEVLAMNALMVFFSLLICVFWGVIGKLKHINVRKKIFISFLMLFDLIQPTLVGETGKLFICKQVDGSYFLIEDMSVSCDESQYVLMIYLIFLPLLLLWSIILPALMFCRLKRNSQRLLESSVYSTYGVFYSCYRTKYYFWDFVIMARENIVIFTSLLRLNLNTRINIILIVLSFSIYYQIHLNPYITDKLNSLERQAILVSILLVFLGLSQVLDCGPGFVVTGAIVTLAFSLVFLLLWLKQYMIFFKKDVTNFVKKHSNLFKRMLQKPLDKTFKTQMKTSLEQFVAQNESDLRKKPNGFFLPMAT